MLRFSPRLSARPHRQAQTKHQTWLWLFFEDYVSRNGHILGLGVLGKVL